MELARAQSQGVRGPQRKTSLVLERLRPKGCVFAVSLSYNLGYTYSTRLVPREEMTSNREGGLSRQARQADREQGTLGEDRKQAQRRGGRECQCGKRAKQGTRWEGGPGREALPATRAMRCQRLSYLNKNVLLYASPSPETVVEEHVRDSS